MRHRLAEPCHDRKLHSTDFIYSFDVGKTNQLLRKQNSDIEPQSHIAYSIVLSSVLFIVILPVHSMYWPTRLQRIMLQIFPRRVRITIQGYGLHSTCRWRWWDSTPVWLFPLSIMRYISFYVIYTCDCTLIYTLMYCVCQHTDPGMAQIHRGLTVWGRVATDMVSEHMLTVGRDPRNWKALG